MEKTIKVPPRNNNKETPRVYPITKGSNTKGTRQRESPLHNWQPFFLACPFRTVGQQRLRPQKKHTVLSRHSHVSASGCGPPASGTWSQSASTPVLLRCEMR